MNIGKDSLTAGLFEAASSKLVVKYNKNGDPSVLVRVPRFNIEDIEPSLGSGPHPAFIVNGVVKNEIYIGAYQATIVKDCASSLPGQAPEVNITYDDAKAICAANGPGWHLMTAWEWAAIALWCMKNGFQPRGNTNYGKSHEAPWETGTGAVDNVDMILTGTGPASWRHDGTYQGISDLVGNIWEWNDGLKIVDGQLYFPVDNSFDMSEVDWPSHPVYFDSPIGPGDREGVAKVGSPILSYTVSTYTEDPLVGDVELDYTLNESWANLTVAIGYDKILEDERKKAAQLLIAPKLTRKDNPLFPDIKGWIWVRNYGTRIPCRGGRWSIDFEAGLGALILDYQRSGVDPRIGFRLAYIP
jgi:hypothetical protein